MSISQHASLELVHTILGHPENHAFTIFLKADYNMAATGRQLGIRNAVPAKVLLEYIDHVLVNFVGH